MRWWPMAASQSAAATAFGPVPVWRFAGRGCGDTRMWDMFVEYADIAAGGDPVGRIKARLAALSASAESQGLTGLAAFDGLRRLGTDLNGELMETRQFCLFYRFVFFMCREQGQKSISVRMAVDAWRLCLTGRFRLLDQWCTFVDSYQRYSISEDTWCQVLEFSRSVHEDLSNYDHEGAWPVLVDDFVDKMCSSEYTLLGGADQHASMKLSFEDDLGASSLSSRAASLPGMPASAGSKRRRKDPKDDAAQVESVNSIAQLLAEMRSPLSCKRVRSSGSLVDAHDPMDEDFELRQSWEQRDLWESVDDDRPAPSSFSMSVGSERMSSAMMSPNLHSFERP